MHHVGHVYLTILVCASLHVFSFELKSSQLEEVLGMIIGCNTCELLEQII